MNHTTPSSPVDTQQNATANISLPTAKTWSHQTDSTTLFVETLPVQQAPAFSYPVDAATNLRIQIPAEWADPEFRSAVVEANIEEGLAWQIRDNRRHRGWTQKALAEKLGTRQAVISRLEDPLYGAHSLRTLLDLARVFDCAIDVRFVPFSTLASNLEALSERDLVAPSFSEERHDPA